MTYSQELLKAAHEYCNHNRDAINNSAVCGCFYCCEIYPAAEVKEYIRSGKNQNQGRDALCPRCGIDSVLADKSGLPLNPAFLEAMHQRWFKTGIEV